jgi:hypothetical protein
MLLPEEKQVFHIYFVRYFFINPSGEGMSAIGDNPGLFVAVLRRLMY